MLDRAIEYMPVFLARRLGRRRKIVAILTHVPRASARVAWELVDREEGSAGFVKQDRLGAVAVVDVEVEYGDALAAIGQGLKGDDRGIVQVTKAHRSPWSGVMARRAHEAEDGFPAGSAAQGRK